MDIHKWILDLHNWTYLWVSIFSLWKSPYEVHNIHLWISIIGFMDIHNTIIDLHYSIYGCP